MEKEKTCYTCKSCKINSHGCIYCSLRKKGEQCISYDKWESQKDVLNKIRAEIEQLPTTKCTETRRIYIDADDFKENVLAILDKYKTESEEE
jgi:hypothetical protein